MPEDLFARIRALQAHMTTNPATRRSATPRKPHGFCSETNQETKHCPQCDSFKVLSEFAGDKSRWDGLTPYCRPCARKRASSNGEDNRRMRESGQRIDFDKLPDGRNAIRCTSCNVLKPLECFHKDSSALRGKKQQCKECWKDIREKKKAQSSSNPVQSS